nr:galactose-specific lectin nattectin-like isoform X1 [Misgurnus anguillicaudatus]
MAVMRALVLLFLVFSVENAAAQHCRYGWSHFGVKCYKFFSELVDWVTAEKNCQSVDANLASVHTRGENNFLLSLVSGDTPVWIGGHDGEMVYKWLWTDGSPFVFTNWCSGEPNNFNDSERCLDINYSNSRCWNDDICYRTKSYICAKPRNAA